MAYTREVLTLAVEIGDMMLRNGAEIYRTEDTVKRILEAYQIEEFDVYVLSNGIFASANEGSSDACSMVRQVPLGDVNLGKIAAINQLTRDICSEVCSPAQARKRLEECQQDQLYPTWFIILCCGLGSAGFCYLFGGDVLDCLFTIPIGMLERYLLLTLVHYKTSKSLTNVICSAFATMLSFLVIWSGLALHQDKIIIGTIMPLFPGIALTTSIRDFYNSDYLSGTIHLIDALLTALCISVGVCLSIGLVQYFGGGVIRL